jgi:hypothetical protein
MKRSDVVVAPNVRHQKRAVGIFKNHEHVENAIRAFKDNDFDMNNVSLLARNVDDVSGGREVNESHGNEASEGAGIGATTGTVLGGVTGFLIGVGVLAIPGVGPILAAGAEIGALGSTLAGAGAGALTGGIVGALVGLGIPEEKAKVYEDRIKAGDYLLMVSGDDDTLHRTESIMGNHHVDDFEIFEAKTETKHRHGNAAAEINHRPADATPVATGNDVPTTQGTHGERVNKEVPAQNSHGKQVTHARDLDNDRQPEVVIEDKRSAAGRNYPQR